MLTGCLSFTASVHWAQHIKEPGRSRAIWGSLQEAVLKL